MRAGSVQCRRLWLQLGERAPLQIICSTSVQHSSAQSVSHRQNGLVWYLRWGSLRPPKHACCTDLHDALGYLQQMPPLGSQPNACKAVWCPELGHGNMLFQVT